MSNNYKLHLYMDGEDRVSIPIPESAAKLIGEIMGGKEYKEGYVWTTVEHQNDSPVNIAKALDSFFINKSNE